MSHIFLWLLVIVEAVIIIALMRQVGTLLLRVGTSPVFAVEPGPSVGETATWLPSEAAAGEDDRLTVLAFVSTSCGACDTLAPGLNAVVADYAHDARVYAISREDEQATADWARRLRLKSPTLTSEEAFQAYAIDGTPYVFVLDSGGRIQARGGVNHLDQLESMLLTCIGARQGKEAVSAKASPEDG
jgi:methylamine dehydrogenase accessory protein MauD